MAQVQAELDSIISLGCQVHLVSFGSNDGAKNWREQSNCNLPIWTNPNRTLYRQASLQRCMSLVWKMEAVKFYGAQIAQNIPLPKPLTDYTDDILQMGGNIFVDSTGKMVHIHASQSPHDRPNVSEIKAIISRLRKS